jgi:hypothetical protein
MGEQGISENTENFGHYEKALEFLGEIGHLSDEKFYRRAVRNAEALIEIFQGTSNALAFLASKQVDPGTIIERIKTIFHRLHFNPSDDYYLAMLLPRYAEESLIQKRWKHLMLIYHPDRKTVSSDYATECTKRLNDIFHVLRDPMRRYAYDQQLTRPGKGDPTRPSSFKQPPKESLSFGNGGGRHSKVILVSLLIAAVALGAGLYYGKTYRPDRQIVSVQEAPRQEAKEAPAEGPPREKIVKHRKGPKVAKSKGVATRVPYTPAQPDHVRHDILLSEEVYEFVSRLTRAYEAGDISAYLSCYSPAAIENSMEYEGIKTFYKALFEVGRLRYSIGNMSIREDSDGIKVSGVFAAGGLTEDNSSISRGAIEMTLIRINGELAIITASKVKDETHPNN